MLKPLAYGLIVSGQHHHHDDNLFVFGIEGLVDSIDSGFTHEIPARELDVKIDGLARDLHSALGTHFTEVGNYGVQVESCLATHP